MIGALVALFVMLWRTAVHPDTPKLDPAAGFVMCTMVALLGAAAEAGAMHLLQTLPRWVS